MVKLGNVDYISEKEVSARFGMSLSWLRRERHLGTGPLYLKLRGNGKVFYPLVETEKWFVDNLKEAE